MLKRVLIKYRRDGLVETLNDTQRYVQRRLTLPEIKARVKSNITDLSYKEAYYEQRNKNQVKGYEELRAYSELHYELMTKFCATSASSLSILEVGFGAGRNLVHLHNQGETDLYGIEISPEAVKLFNEEHPTVANDTEVLIGDGNEKLKEYDDGYFDVVFSNAVLSHILRDSDELFNQMTRVSSDVLITAEHEKLERIPNSVIPPGEREYYKTNRLSNHICPRDYKSIFENKGYKCVEVINGWDDTEYGDLASSISLGSGPHGTVRVFKKE